MRLQFVIVASAFLSAGCSPTDNSDWAKSFTFERVSQDVLRKSAKDPSSIEFRNMRYDIQAGVTCGEYSGANSLGGKSGFSRFVLSPTGGSVEEANPEEFEVAAVKCIGARPREHLQGAP